MTPRGGVAEWLAAVAPRTEMGERVRTFDWAATPLGHPDTWSTGLRTAVRICLSSGFPILVVWGPELVKIYNDAYVDMLGREKHPDALGRPVRAVWPEIWEQIGPMFESVLETGEPTFTEHGQLVVERNGFAEEAFFTWSYSAIYDDDGSIGGVFDVAVETTEQVFSERRMAAVAGLARELLVAEGVTSACLATTRGMARWRDDVRAADVYLRIGDELTLVSTNRLAEAPPVPQLVLRSVAEEQRARVLGQREGANGPAEHVVVPLGVDEGRARGVLVASLDSRVPYDRGFERYLELVASTVGSALDNAARRDLELGEHRRINETLQAAMLTPITDTGTVAARYVAAVGNLAVGGDWYDLVDLDDNCRALIVGDCVGHGLEAATAMGQLRAAARAMVLEGRDPASVLHGLDAFAGSVDGAFCATVVCAVIDRNLGEITYSRAGHPPPLLSGPEGDRWLDGGLSVPLGASTTHTRTTATATMGPDDLLVLYSDGLVERRGEPLDEGLGRLADAVRRTPRRESVASVADRLLRELSVEESADDVVVVVKRLTP